MEGTVDELAEDMRAMSFMNGEVRVAREEMAHLKVCPYPMCTARVLYRSEYTQCTNVSSTRGSVACGQ